MKKVLALGLSILISISCASSNAHTDVALANANQAPPVENTSSIAAPIDSASTEKLEILPYCEIANNPEKYNGKVVRFRARLYWFDHGFFMRDEECSSEFPQKPSNLDDRYYDRTLAYYDRRAAISFTESNKNQFWDKLKNSTQLPPRHSNIIAKGRFLFREPCLDGEICSDMIVHRVFFEFQIIDLESVTVPNYP